MRATLIVTLAALGSIVSGSCYAGGKNHYYPPHDDTKHSACRSLSLANAAGLRLNGNYRYVRVASYQACMKSESVRA